VPTPALSAWLKTIALADVLTLEPSDVIGTLAGVARRPGGVDVSAISFAEVIERTAPGQPHRQR
jgi:hypothetical protein